MNHNAMILAGSTALSPVGPDAELIATCAAFCELERASDVVTKGFAGDFAKEAEGEAPLAKIVAEQDALVERMITLPCTSLDGVQAMALALATWDRELLKDSPASDVGEAITANMVERLLALRHPDADLLAVCSEFCASEAAYSAIYDDAPEDSDEATCDALANPIAGQWNGMLDRMAQLHVTTSEGLAARAMALAQHSGIKPGTDSYPFAFQPDDAEDVTGRLLHMLLSDALRMIGGPLPVLDADLLALRPEFDRLHAVMIDYNTPGVMPEADNECAAFDGLCDRIATAKPAVTADGRAFQAAAAMHNLFYRISDCEDDVVWLMLKGIAGDAYQSTEGRA